MNLSNYFDLYNLRKRCSIQIKSEICHCVLWCLLLYFKLLRDPEEEMYVHIIAWAVMGCAE